MAVWMASKGSRTDRLPRRSLQRDRYDYAPLKRGGVLINTPPTVHRLAHPGHNSARAIL